MRFKGTLKTWHDERGFGFVTPEDGGPDVFVHMKDFPAGSTRPHPAMALTFDIERGADGKLRARNVVNPAAGGLGLHARSFSHWSLSSKVVLSGFLLCMVVVALVWRLPLGIALGYLVMSVTCALMYLHDKEAALNKKWRVSEATLIVLGLCGGWPGGLVAQQVLRHKTAKTSFQVPFWITVGTNLLLFIAVFTPILRLTLSR